MKKVFIVLMMALLSLGIQAQEPLVFEQVITKEGKTAGELYSLIKRWVATNYKSAKNVIQLDTQDKEIMLKPKIDFQEKSLTWAAASGYIDYTVDFLIKDDRFKVIIGPFSHVSTHYKWGKEWSNGVIYKEEITDELLDNIGIKKIARKQYRAIDKRVRPLTKNEIETIMYSLINKLDNVEKSDEKNWDF